MPSQDYKWKRFWCPRSGHINLADGGYLCDPEEKWGKIYNPDLVTFDAISALPCLALLGEPGIGKSHTIEAEKNEIIKEIQKQGGQVLSLDIRSYGSEDRLVSRLFDSLEFTQWLKGTHQLHIFLDSLDECLLRIKTLATLLVDEFKRYQNHIQRLHLRIACRTAVWQPVLEEGLKEIWGKDSVGIYELAPLRRVDVSKAAKIEGIDNSEAFLEEINRKNVVPLAIKPITLEFLIKTYRNYDGKFPLNQRLHELYLEGCLWLCEERNKSRISSKLKGKLKRQERLMLAARIAAITIFGNKFAIWTGIQSDVPDDDVFIEKICQGTETVDGREFEISEEAVEEVLDTGLFSSRGELSRMGWAHQTYAEFLAAWYLVQHETPLNEVIKLIVSPEDPEHKLIPQLHETAAWLASMRTDVLQEIMKTDPDVLLRSDIPTDANLRAAIVDNLLKQYEQGKLFDSHRDNYPRYEKFKHSGLAVQLLPYIQDLSKPIDARNAAIDIAEACKVDELQEELVNLALDSSQSIYLRASAAKAICTIGNASARLRLKSLIYSQMPEDEDDQLKGYIFRAIWSDHLPVEELFNVLTPPKKRNFTGSYRVFLDFELVPKLQSCDLLVALKWVEKQGLRCFGHSFERLADAIMLKAWEHLDLPGLAESFTKVALIQWREHQKIITFDNEIQAQFELSLVNNLEKRRKLVEQAVITVSQSGENIYFLLHSLTENTLLTEDVFWMLGKLQNIDSQQERIWTALIQWKFKRDDLKQINAVLEATQTNNILREEFAFYFSTIDLDSMQAENLRSNYQRMQEQQNRRQKPILDPPPQERVLLFLEQLESGNLLAWWQINMEMLLKPDSQSYEQELESDLTKLPGWQEADRKTRERIINGAKKYIQEYNQVAYEWIGTNTYDRPALAGCKALQLLLQETPEFLDTISSKIWQRWASVIVAFPHSSTTQREHYYTELVKRAYINAPSETLNTLLSIINKENEEHGYIFILNKFEKCWDEPFKAVLLEKAKDATIKPKCIGQLLEELLKRESIGAREFAKSLVSIPLPLEEEAHQKAVVAGRVLVECAEPSSWAVIWSAIHQNTDFGREVFEAVAYRYSHGLHLKLTEKQLADLYIWLVCQYPHCGDPDYSNDVLAHNMGARESVANLRDSVLTQLRETGTSQACIEIEHIAEEFPELTWLKKTLLKAHSVKRRKNWQPLKPEEILQIVTHKKSSPMKTILILAANPNNSTPLRLGEEVREIDEGLRRSQKRDQFRLEQKWAVRAADVRRALLDHEPQIVHFCGHGSGNEGLVLEDKNGQSKLVTTEALANTFELCAEHVECVLLNACYSEVQAEGIVEYIDYVIGMNDAIGDAAAIHFATGFYDALGAGKSIENAYKWGCNAIQSENLPDHLKPKLKKKK
ncbi:MULTISPECIES: CHAT domain-containing protein [unclassified Nostoc]|uniref:CHAT domain-containing protein n=1 Tax=unclassified Nostoc TaxID=2593658 RepID=UPI002AD41A34|nr:MULTISPECIES: CHAT domain-containing protein [unclassified Nostoc]MDZ8127191.1 CHAT domain-containing protein [Nostoc sp. CmiVER01]MDZ8222474.1 CHAT domain-containing protein [Nostoc sp. ChiVER01]